MSRSACMPAVAFASFVLAASVSFAQTPQPASAPAAPAPAARAKWIAPVKGQATIEVIKGDTKRVGEEMVTVLKVRNTSSGAIALLRVDEYWYDRDRKSVSGDTQRHRSPLNPGEIVEITMKSPVKPNLYTNQFSFSHANGTVDVKLVKKFTEEKK